MKKSLDVDISAIPFSRFGSYIAFSFLKGEKYTEKGLTEGVWMRCLHGDVLKYELMRFELIEDNKSVPLRIDCTASKLTLKGKSGQVEICIPTADNVRIRALGTKLRITALPFRNHYAIPESDGSWIFNIASSFRSYRLTPLNGELKIDAPWEIKRCSHMIAELSATGEGFAEMAIEQLTWNRPVQAHSIDFESLVKNVHQEFSKFCKPFLDCPERYKETAKKAAFIDWSSVVHPNGKLSRPTMYMSKNWMTNVWAWDHAFNALAVSMSDPDLAWDQLMVIFDHQNKNGQIPDFINDMRLMTCFVKPPIHGWIVSLILKLNGELSPERLEVVYDKLSKWSQWWLNFRNPDKDGLPVYWHGNDSGWDNATVFDANLPVKAPDLTSFLILQMEMLADFAKKLGRNNESENWQQQADESFKNLINTLWDGKKFRCLSMIDGKFANNSDSVFNSLPIILGKRLPSDIRKTLVTEIKRHLTEWGVATENPKSTLYESEGYWRGPIWAPSTMIIIEGLRVAGETQMAKDLANRFCELCKKNGFAENFDALKGTPLYDPAYTWTSSVFLVLANKYL